MNWLNSPCTDPSGRVYEHDGRFYRAIHPGREGLIEALLASGTLQRLSDLGLLAPTRIACEQRVDGHKLILETQAAPFDVPCDRFSLGALRAAALCWIDTALVLESTPFRLSDAHFGNFMLFGANQPRMIDIGSLQLGRDVAAERPFASCTAFCANVVGPLLALARRPELARVARLAIGDHPYNGPSFPANDGPLELGSISPEHGVAAVASEAGLGDDQPPREALERLRAILARLTGTCDVGAAARASDPIDTALASAIDAAGTSGAARVVCVGADAYAAVRGRIGDSAALVIEDRPRDLDALDTRLRSSRPSLGAVSLCLGTPLNRALPAPRLRGDLVVAARPFERLAHVSAVMFENIAGALAGLTRSRAIVTVAAEHLESATRALSERFARVVTIPPSGANADHVALDCERRA